MPCTVAVRCALEVLDSLSHKHSAFCSTKAHIDSTSVRGCGWVSIGFLYRTRWWAGIWSVWILQSTTQLPFLTSWSLFSLTWDLMWVETGIQHWVFVTIPSTVPFLCSGSKQENCTARGSQGLVFSVGCIRSRQHNLCSICYVGNNRRCCFLHLGTLTLTNECNQAAFVYFLMAAQCVVLMDTNILLHRSPHLCDPLCALASFLWSASQDEGWKRFLSVRRI